MSYDNNLHAFLTCIVEALGREFIIEGMTWDGEGRERVTLTLDTIPRGLLVTPLADLPSRIRAPAMHEVSLGRFTWTATSGTANAPAPGLPPGSDGSRMDLTARLQEARRQRDIQIQREREISAILAQQRERESVTALAHQQRDIATASMGPLPSRPMQARRSAPALPSTQQHPVLRPTLPVPTSHSRGRARSANSGCNVEGCPGAKRARVAGHGYGYSHVLASLLCGEPSTSSREQVGVYGRPEPGTSGEGLTPILCSGTHTVVQGVGAHIISNPTPTLQSLARCAAGAGQRPPKKPTLSQRLSAATLVALHGVPREPTPPPPQLSPALPVPSEEEGLPTPTEEVLVETTDNGEGEAETEDFSVPTSGELA